MRLKKALAILMTSTLVLSLAACGGNEKENTAVDTIIEPTQESSTVADETPSSVEEVVESTVESTETETNESLEDVVKPDITFGSKLIDAFNTGITETTDLEALGNKFIEDGIFGEVMMGCMPIEPGYLSGFGDTEINCFNTGVMVSPMIGTIPCVIYIFETDDVDLLTETLENNHDLRWNICTSADEMVITTYENYVFFAMTPYTMGE